MCKGFASKLSVIFIISSVCFFAEASQKYSLLDVVKIFDGTSVSKQEKPLEKIPVYNFKRSQNRMSFRAQGHAIQLQWDMETKIVFLNGHKITKKDYKNKKSLKRIIYKVFNSRSNKTWYSYLFIPPAHASNLTPAMQNAINQLVRNLFQQLLSNGFNFQGNNNNMVQAAPVTENYNETTSGYEIDTGVTGIPDTNRPNPATAPVAPAPVAPANNFPPPGQSIATTSACPSGYDPQACMAIQETNKHRVANGLPALKVSKTCTDVATQAAYQMRKNNDMSHSYYHQISRRYNMGMASGENIAKGNSLNGRSVVTQAWMTSPGHRENILRRRFTHIGIAKNGAFWSQVFCTR